MLGFLRARLNADRFDAPVAPDGPVYAIGDVHGRADKLDVLLERVAADAEARGGAAEIVFLGDYVDRGEESRGVVERLIAMTGAARPPVLLRGNHEQMLLDFIESPGAGPLWLRNGGIETVLSYGVPLRPSEMREEKDLAALRDRLAAAMGGHLDFLRRLKLSHRSGNVLFVHAAADPALPPDAQSPTTLIWGPRDGVMRPRRDGVWVAHGHVVVDRPVAEQGRISIDTGACYGGKLTAARISPGAVEFISV